MQPFDSNVKPEIAGASCGQPVDRPLPFDGDALLAAALDGGDIPMAAAAILSHPGSLAFPAPLVGFLGAVAFGRLPTTPKTDSAVREAAKLVLPAGGRTND